jgi:alpha-mannosidase
VSLARAAKYPDPGADHGHNEVSFALRVHDGDLADVRAAAALLNGPPRVVTNGLRAEVPPLPAVRLTAADERSRGVEVDAVKMADDRSGDLIVRLHEACGDRAQVSLAAARRIVAAWHCDLLETASRGDEVSDGHLALTLRPFELATLRLRLGDEFDGRSIDTSAS